VATQRGCKRIPNRCRNLLREKLTLLRLEVLYYYFYWRYLCCSIFGLFEMAPEMPSPGERKIALKRGMPGQPPGPDGLLGVGVSFVPASDGVRHVVISVSEAGSAFASGKARSPSETDTTRRRSPYLRTHAVQCNLVLTSFRLGRGFQGPLHVCNRCAVFLAR
jgi:hypothetical protein